MLQYGHWFLKWLLRGLPDQNYCACQLVLKQVFGLVTTSTTLHLNDSQICTPTAFLKATWKEWIPIAKIKKYCSLD